MPVIATPTEPRGTSAPAFGTKTAKRKTGFVGLIYSFIGWFLETFIIALVWAIGRRVRLADAPWLICPMGDSEHIGAEIYERIAHEENLELKVVPDAGLIADFDALRGPSFDPDAVHPRVKHFYEHAAQYKLEAWSEVALVGKFFLWLLVEFISQRVDQLNFPISPLEMAGGMSSQILQLRAPGTGQLVYTGWLRKLKSSGMVMFAGIYSIARIPDEENPCVKVTFPDCGSASVYLRPVNHADGSFGLHSSGAKFGKSGFYRLVASGKDHVYVRDFKSLHEIFRVYEDAEGILRTDHTISFVGMTIVRLHYKVTLNS